MTDRKREDVAGHLSRRQLLAGLGGGLSALTLGCGSDGVRSSEAEALLGSESGDETGPSAELSGAAAFAGIDAVVVLMMENRSFDHYLGSLRSDALYPDRANVDGLRGSESNPDGRGGHIAVFRTSNRTPKDPPHSWNASHKQWNGGKNDGFATEHAGAGSEQREVMGFHDRSAIPFYYALADRFAVCDRWFASVMGPTFPNRFYLHAGTSFGLQKNAPQWNGGVATVWDRMKDKGLAAKNYTAGLVTFHLGGFPGRVLLGKNPSARLSEFFADAKRGTLPPFSIIDPDFLSNDDHPSHDINLGQALMASIVQALAKSPQWSRTLLVITYDEHGGFFDHVSPPTVADDRPEFRQLGFRVPSLVIGPTVWSGRSVHTVYDHTSVLATLRSRYGITDLSKRMAAAADLGDCIDPAKIGKPSPPPTGLPKVPVRLSTALRLSGESSQPELEQLANSESLRAHVLDDRPLDARIREFLQQAEELGAVELLD
jgi:phospholipase C